MLATGLIMKTQKQNKGVSHNEFREWDSLDCGWNKDFYKNRNECRIQMKSQRQQHNNNK